MQFILAYKCYMVVYFLDIYNKNLEAVLRPAYAQWLIESRKLNISAFILHVSFVMSFALCSCSTPYTSITSVISSKMCSGSLSSPRFSQFHQHAKVRERKICSSLSSIETWRNNHLMLKLPL